MVNRDQHSAGIRIAGVCTTVFLALLCVCPSALAVQDQDNEPMGGDLNIGSYAESLINQPARTTSGYFHDEIFGTYGGSDLDTYTRAADGPIDFDIEVDRVFSKNGLDFSYLLVGQPQLVLYVKDVDSQCPYPLCEVDLVYLNGHYIGTLTGANDTWNIVSFDIPIDWFSQGYVNTGIFHDGLPPGKIANQVQIYVDVLGSQAKWGVKVDWAEIRIKGIRPAVLLNGIFGDATSWDQFKPFIPGDLSKAYSLPEVGTIEQNGDYINRAIIDNAKKIFGVGRVNIIAHSKGGLDTEYAVNELGADASVENFITLGSPFTGTEYADHWVMDHDWLYGTYAWILDPDAARSLTTGSRAKYYADHPTTGSRVPLFNMAGVQYSAAETRCLFGIDAPVPIHQVQIFNEVNDGWVPLSRTVPPYKGSADLVRADSHVGLQLVLPSGPADPRPMLEDSQVAAWAVNLMRGSVSHAGTQSTIISSNSGEPVPITPASSYFPNIIRRVPTPSARGGLIRGGTTATHDIKLTVLDSDLDVFFGYSDPKGPPALALRDPSGTVIPLSYDTEKQTGAYHDSAPAPGVWTFEIAPGVDTVYDMAATTSSDITLSVALPTTVFQPDEDIQFTAILEWGNLLIPGANVSADVLDDNGEVVESLALTDSGDGLYAATYDPGSDGGRFNGIRVMAKGRFDCQPAPPPATGFVCNTQLTPSGNQRFAREVTLPSIVRIPDSVHLDPNVPALTNFAEDLDEDGLFDQLHVYAYVVDLMAGNYLAVGDLEDESGTYSTRTSTFFSIPAPINAATPILNFNGRDIHGWGVDGPYVLRRLDVIDLSRGGAIATTGSMEYHTQPYSFYEFSGPILDFGSAEDHLEDSDGDGVPDLLVISVEVIANPIFADAYTVNASVSDDTGAFSQLLPSSGVSIVPGVNSIRFEIPDQQLLVQTSEAVFRLTDFSLVRDSDPDLNLVRTNVYTTGVYQMCEFQHPPSSCETGSGGGSGGGNDFPDKPLEGASAVSAPSSAEADSGSSSVALPDES